MGQQNSESYKSRDLKSHLDNIRTKEGCSKGGQVASLSLREWIKNNKEEHRLRCQELGKRNSQKRKIPHEYEGVVYESKKSLQEATKLSNTGFYAKLRRGEIKRLIEAQGNKT